MKKIKFNKKTLFIVLGVLLLGILTVLGTYAYFGWSSTEVNKDATIAVSSVNGLGQCDKVTDNQKILWPVSSRDKGRIVNVNAKQTLSEYAYITWTLTIDSINTQDTETTGLKHQTFKYELVNTTTGVSYGSGNFEGKEVGDTITFSNNTENLAYDTTYTFTLYLWIDGTIGKNPLDMTEQPYQFSLVCDITGEATNKVHQQIVPPITIEPTDASFFNYTIENNEVIITGYNSDASATYTVTDQSACESYLENNLYNCDSDTECITNAEQLCENGINDWGDTLERFIIDGETIPSSDYSAAGLSNVVITPAPTDVVIPSTIERYPVTTIYGGNCPGPVQIGVQNMCGAFTGTGLTSVVIPNSVTSIGAGAFRNNQLVSVEIPNSVTSIGAGAFRNNQLVSVEIPSSVTTIGASAFANAFNTTGNVTLNIDMETIPSDIFDNKGIKYLVLGEHVTGIASSAFASNQLTSVVIPSSVIGIGDYTFEGNPLTSITIGNENVTIGNCAFGVNPPLEEPFLSNYSCYVGPNN